MSGTELKSLKGSFPDDAEFENAVRADIESTIVNSEGNFCPFAIRLSWHASGTYDKDDDTGGSDGATMRFDPESSDEANAGLDIIRKLLEPVKLKHPNLSYADLWTLAGVHAIKLMEGPDIAFKFGRSDKDDNTTCPMNGRLPDAAQGAQHLRDIFFRMGFDDKDIVALSGAHTVGACHRDRSGFDGYWTYGIRKFDNEYFVNLINQEWKVREWDGPLQYTDVTGKLMMLPSDIALIKDPIFLQYVQHYAINEKDFFADFSTAFGKLIALGCPAHVNPESSPVAVQLEPAEEEPAEVEPAEEEPAVGKRAEVEHLRGMVIHVSLALILCAFAYGAIEGLRRPRDTTPLNTAPPTFFF